MADDSNKSEQASPFKLKEAKDKGQVSKSAEVTGLLMLVTTAATFLIVASNIWDVLQLLMRNLINNAGHINVSANNVFNLTFELITTVVGLFAPIIVVLVLGAIFFNVTQTGPILSGHPITPDWKRLNPVEGAKKIFAKKTLFDLFKALLKVGAILLIWLTVGPGWLNTIMMSFGMSLSGFTHHWFESTISLLFLIVAVLLPLAVLDFGFAKWDFAKKMMMSTQDVKDEYKKREGDPQIKQKQKQIQQELLKKAASLKSVKDADVIITNPEHIAVALKFTPLKMLAPKVLAMGEDHNAAIIRKIARSYNVPIMRNVPLARKLYKGSAINGYIPESCYNDVAQIFRHLLGMDKVQESGMPK